MSSVVRVPGSKDAELDDIAFRLATAGDCRALAGLITELGSPTTPDDMALRLAAMEGRSDLAALLALADGEIAAMAGLRVSRSFIRNTPDGQIIAMVVAAKHRGRGIGRRLLKEAEGWLAARRCAGDVDHGLASRRRACLLPRLRLC
jgi:GNAT superfamily N-acetyltransferase